jgi:hypothetical protein
MSSNRDQNSNETIGPEKLTRSVRQDRYCFETFCQEPMAHVKGILAEPSGTSLVESVLRTGRYAFEYAFCGDNTDIFIPTLASDGGYNFGGSSDVAGTGFELSFGGLKLGHPRNFTPVGVGPFASAGEDWFARVLLITDDASGVDLFFGFRKVAAYAATLTEYSDVAGIRILGTSDSSDATFTIVTNLNNAGSTDYSSTTPSVAVAGLEDATAVELEVRAVGGRALFFKNGVQILGASYTFDTGDTMKAVLRMLQATDVAAQIKVLAYEAGPLADRQEGTLLSLAGSTI